MAYGITTLTGTPVNSKYMLMILIKSDEVVYA